jgi:hypothetical protein
MEQKLTECLEGLDKSGSFEDISTLEDKHSEDLYDEDEADIPEAGDVDFIDGEEENENYEKSEIVCNPNEI